MRSLLPFLVALCFGLAANAAERPPNIVIFFIDDMGFADPSCFGNPQVETPHIDKLAAQGIKLHNFYVNSPICSASRTALTTGQYQGRWGIHSYLASRAANESRGMKHFLDPTAPTIARALKERGYATAHFGKWHMGGGRDIHEAPRPKAYGMDEALVCFEGMGDKLLFNEREKSGTRTDIHGEYTVTVLPKHKLTETYADRSIDFIKRNKNKPFYLRLFPNDVHDAHKPTPEQEAKWKDATDNPFERKFFAVLEEMDRQLGRVVSAIDELGLGEDTLILFTSDNGPTDWPSYYGRGVNPPGFTGPYFGRKWSLFEGGIRMPFIARWTNTIPAGREDKESVVCAIDLSPTLRAFAGAAKHPAPDGHDRGSVLLGTPSARPEPVFWQYGAPHAKLMPGKREFVSPSFAVRDGTWKLLVNGDGTEAHLFDLATDPGEQTNRFAAEPARADALWQQIQTWAKDVGYPVAGELVAPKPPPKIESIDWEHAKGKTWKLEGHDIIRRNNTWYFNGTNSWLALPRTRAPKVAKKSLRILASVEPRSGDDDDGNGVLFAHGGNRMGYALYLVDRKPHFVVTSDWTRTVVAGTKPLPFDMRSRLDAKLEKDGSMSLRLNGELLAEATSKLLPTDPGDSIEIGADKIQPVGEYPAPNYFLGTIYHLKLEVK